MTWEALTRERVLCHWNLRGIWLSIVLMSKNEEEGCIEDRREEGEKEEYLKLQDCDMAAERRLQAKDERRTG